MAFGANLLSSRRLGVSPGARLGAALTGSLGQMDEIHKQRSQNALYDRIREQNPLLADLLQADAPGAAIKALTPAQQKDYRKMAREQAYGQMEGVFNAKKAYGVPLFTQKAPRGGRGGGSGGGKAPKPPALGTIMAAVKPFYTSAVTAQNNPFEGSMEEFIQSGRLPARLQEQVGQALGGFPQRPSPVNDVAEAAETAGPAEEEGPNILDKAGRHLKSLFTTGGLAHSMSEEEKKAMIKNAAASGKSRAELEELTRALFPDLE